MTRISSTLLLLLIIGMGWSQDAPLPADMAPAHMKMPEGFRATLLASEPLLKKPIAMTVDERGRLWVVESHSYPAWIQEAKTGKVTPGQDRILIIDGDKLTVAWDQGKNLSGIAVGFGGLWLCSTPNLVFLPMQNDKPSGPPRIVLDGWDTKAVHNVFNTLRFGPDGWLYGCNGINSNSVVGKPGTPKEQRTSLNCGVWRYHPTKERFEAFAHGTTNPWGIDFDDHGELFITNCVIKHIFHVPPGAHFVRMFGQDINPHSYRLIESHADHIHWAGGDWRSSRGAVGAHSESGGGHAHTGCMFYLGDNWPDEYRNRVFMHNIHGNRVNMDTLVRQGSGYAIQHGPDFLLARDPWFRGMALEYGPDGAVFMSDWCDTGECHNYEVVQPLGRIYKVAFGQLKPVVIDLKKLSDRELAELQAHKNDWYVRHARRILQERAAVGKIDDKAIARLRLLLAMDASVTRKLRALWALHVIGAIEDKDLIGLLNHAEETLRGWAIRLLLEDQRASAGLVTQLAEMARQEKSAWVRLALASGLQRLPLAQRWSIAEGLVSHDEDWNDANLPLMIWYGIEPAVPSDPERAVALLARSSLRFIRESIARRIASTSATPDLSPLVRLLNRENSADIQHDVLKGLHLAFQGRRDLKMPAGWADTQARLAGSSHAEVRRLALVLSVLFGDARAFNALQAIAASGHEKPEIRQSALQTLIELRSPDLLPLLRGLLADAAVRPAAVRGLAAVNDPTVPNLLIQVYARLTAAEKLDAIQTLVSRPSYAAVLLDALEAGAIPRQDVSIFAARQVLNFKDAKLAKRLDKVWGVIRPTAKDKVALLAKYRTLATPLDLHKADRVQGRAVFNRVCASCHVLFDAGGKIGPDLTGSQRTNPDYILGELLDPGAVVARDYQLSVIETSAGRIINGIVVQDTGQTVVVQTQNERITLAKADIAEQRVLPQSMMPEGMLAQLSDAEIRNLLAYLAGKEQVGSAGK